jgi:hypothetical protein
LNSIVFSTTKEFHGTQIGGLSGISKVGETYWVASDDKGQRGEPRVYGFSINLSDLVFTVKAENVVFLRDKKGQSFIKNMLDIEGIVSNGNRFWLSSEGLLNIKPRSNPAILEFGLDGKLQSEISVPSQYLPEQTGKQKRGVRSNGAFEGLSLSPSGNFLWICVENPLVQEFPNWKLGYEGEARLLRYQKSKNSWQFESEWRYPLEEAGIKGKDAGAVLGQGCSEILALSDTEILMLERGVSVLGMDAQYNIKLSEVSIKGLNSRMEATLSKVLVFDFSTIKEKIPDGLGLDNFEGFTWGPQTNGQKTLIFVSDDNFSSLQRTVWLALRVK